MKNNKDTKAKDPYTWIQVDTLQEFVTVLEMVKQTGKRWKGGREIDVEMVKKPNFYFMPCQVGISKQDVVCKIEINLDDLGVKL